MSIEEIELKHGNNHRVLKLEWHEESYVCEGCKEQGSGFRYQYKQGTEIVAYHKICACPREAIRHTFFSKDAVQFFGEDKAQGDCNACGKVVGGFHYKVINENGSKICCLHPSCATLPRVRRAKEGDLILGDAKCLRCGSTSENHPKSWCNCLQCDSTSCRTHPKKSWSKCLWCHSTTCVKHPKSWCYEYGEKWCLHLACVREMIQRDASSLPTGHSNGREEFWRIVEQGLAFIIALLMGDVTGVITGNIVYYSMRLLRGKT